MDLGEYRAFAVELAHASGDFIRHFYGAPDVAVDVKADASPVTAADRGAEQLMRRMIGARFPHHGIIGEELGPDRADAEWVWVLDPIDGTKSFITAVPLWGTLIALLHHGEPVLGCIHQPILGQLLLGDGRSTTLNGQAVRTRSDRSLQEATLLTSDIGNLARYQDPTACERLLAQPRLVRTWGDCYGYLLLATGWADVSLDPIMNPWDIGALVPVVRGAGGVITNWRGGPPYPADSIIAAATPSLHAEVLATLDAPAGPSQGRS